MGLQPFPFPASLESSCHLLSSQVSEQQLLSTLTLGAWLWEFDSPGLSPSCWHRTMREHSCCLWEPRVLKRWLLSSHQGRQRLWQWSALGTKPSSEALLQSVNFCFPYVVASWRPHGHCQPRPLMQTLNMQHHLQCPGTRPCEHSTSADRNIPTLMNFKKFCFLRR